MLILLPPSEGKASPSRGRPLDLDTLSFPALTEPRRATIDALIAASGRADALQVLKAPAGAADAVEGNRTLWSAPTAAVRDLYTGVLYDALDAESLDAGARRRAGRWLVVQSAAFGALRFGDRVPSYRLSMGVTLPGPGRLAAHWRAHLDEPMADAAGTGTVVDLRSSTYAAAWKPSGAVAQRTVAVAVVRDGPEGRTAVSHMAKHTRGLVARTLVVAGGSPRTPEDVAETVAADFRVDLGPPSRAGDRTLTVVEPST